MSYAATAYGVQGATVTTSRSVLTDATSVAGVYVGMTRGWEANRLHVVAESMADARAQFVEAMERDPADRGLDHAIAQAVEAVRGLVADGPVKLVTHELARLDQEAERAEHQAAKEQTRTQRASARDNWGGELPRTSQALPVWAAQAAARKAEGDPRVVDAARAVEAARTDRETTSRRHKQERFALLARELGAEHARGDQFGMRTVNPQCAARDAFARATLARAGADELRNLPVNDAARRIEAQRLELELELEQARQRAAEQARQFDPLGRDPDRRDPGRDGPARSL